MRLNLPPRIGWLARDRRGSALLETAILLPTVLFLGLGGLELANLAIANMRVSQIASKLADNASRVSADAGLPLPQIREADVNELLAVAIDGGAKLDLQKHGRVILSSLEVNPGTGEQWIHWQRCAGNKIVASRYGGEGKTGVGFLGMGESGETVSAPPNGAVMFVEVVYDYQPLVYGSLVGSKQLRYNASFMVRDDRDLTQIYNPAPAAAVATCT